MKPDDTTKRGKTARASWMGLYRYAMLVITLGLVGWCMSLLWESSPGNRRISSALVVSTLMLLLQHLTFYFKWPRRVGIVLRIVTVSWLFLGMLYVFYVLGKTVLG